MNRARKAVRGRDSDSGRAPAVAEKLTGPQAAKVAGVEPGTWRSYTTPKASRKGKIFGPPPDGHGEPCGCAWWYRSTVEAFRDRK